MEAIRLELMTANYWEHYRYFHELTQSLPLDHPKRHKYYETIERLSKELNDFKDAIKTK